jgi:hypothetical protein
MRAACFATMLNLILALLTQRIIIPGIDGTMFNFNQGCTVFPEI